MTQREAPRAPTERDLPPIEVPATLAGVNYILTDLSKKGQGEEYTGCDTSNGNASTAYLLTADGRRFPMKPGQSAYFDLEVMGIGVTWLAVVGNANLAAGDVVLIPTVRGPPRG